MKKSELRQIIREEIGRLMESSFDWKKEASNFQSKIKGVPKKGLTVKAFSYPSGAKGTGGITNGVSVKFDFDPKIKSIYSTARFYVGEPEKPTTGNPIKIAGMEMPDEFPRPKDTYVKTVDEAIKFLTNWAKSAAVAYKKLGIDTDDDMLTPKGRIVRGTYLTGGK